MVKLIARWRTWIVNVALAAAVIVPEVLRTPEVLAIIPEGYRNLIIAGMAIINIWMRPRPAVLPSDLK